MDEKVEPTVQAPSQEAAFNTLIKPQAREPYDSSVTFEEYSFYAQKTRAEELTLESPVLNIRRVLGGKHGAHDYDEQITTNLTAGDFTHRERRLLITDEEWTNASRAFRSASWGACESSHDRLRYLNYADVFARLLSYHHRHHGAI